MQESVMLIEISTTKDENAIIKATDIQYDVRGEPFGFAQDRLVEP